MVNKDPYENSEEDLPADTGLYIYDSKHILGVAASQKQWQMTKVNRDHSRKPNAYGSPTKHLIILVVTVTGRVPHPKYIMYMVVSTRSKNISQNGNFPQVGVKIKIFETTT